MAFLTESKRHRPLHRRRRGPRPGVPGQRLCAEQEQLIRPPGLFNALDLDSSHPLLIDHLVVHPLEIAASVYLLEPRVEILEAEIGLRATAQIDAGHFGQLALQDLWVHTQAMGHDTDFLHRRHRRRPPIAARPGSQLGKGTTFTVILPIPKSRAILREHAPKRLPSGAGIF
jgi:hypothetical protein